MNTKQRDALIGASFLALVSFAVFAASIARGKRAVDLVYTVRSCFEDWSRCRSASLIRLRGAYSPGSEVFDREGCATRFDLQASSAELPGRIPVCADRTLTVFGASGSPGLVQMEVVGHFDGDRFEARDVLRR
jgi:hypothetical protein